MIGEFLAQSLTGIMRKIDFLLALIGDFYLPPVHSRRRIRNGFSRVAPPLYVRCNFPQIKEEKEEKGRA